MKTFHERYVRIPFTTCWIWEGCKQGNNGYGAYQHEKKRVLAHRFSYLIHKGEIPKGMSVCHACDEPSCVNPDHLFIGTHADNMRDMERKGRSNSSARIEAARMVDKRGELHPSAKLTEQAVIFMRQLKRDGRTYKELSVMFGVNHRTVTSAVLGHTWSHLPGSVEPKWTRKGK